MLLEVARREKKPNNWGREANIFVLNLDKVPEHKFGFSIPVVKCYSALIQL